MRAIDLYQQRFIFRPDVVATLLDGGAVLLDLDSKYFYRLNRTGWAIAKLFESGAKVSQVREYCRSIGAQPEDDAAITAVIEMLTSDRLIEPMDDDTAEAGQPISVNAGDSWMTPTIEKQSEPLQRVIISAFDPSVPLVE